MATTSTSTSPCSRSFIGAVVLVAVLVQCRPGRPGAADEPAAPSPESGTGSPVAAATLVVAAEPDACAVWLDGEFAGLTGSEDQALVLTVVAGDHELRLTHPGRLDDCRQVTAPVGETVPVRALLPVLGVATRQPAFVPRIGIGQTIRAWLPAPAGESVARSREYRFAPTAGDRGMLVLQSEDLDARILAPDGTSVALTAVEPVVGTTGRKFFEFTPEKAGDHLLVLTLSPSRAESAVLAKLLRAPPPHAQNPDGTRNRRRQPPRELRDRK